MSAEHLHDLTFRPMFAVPGMIAHLHATSGDAAVNWIVFARKYIVNMMRASIPL